MNKPKTLAQRPITDKLFLLDIKPTAFSEGFAQYRDDNGLLYIKGCRRDVLVGHADTAFQKPVESEGVTVYEGTQAYAHLLTYITGLISRTRGESQIVSQFKNAYNELEGRDAKAAKGLYRVYTGIMRDNSIVRNNVTPALKPAFYEACAHELSGQQAHDTVLIVANAQKGNGKPDAITENLVRYLGGNKKSAAKKIIFTHPDKDTLRRVHSYFLSQKVKGKISTDIEMLGFDDALDATSDLQAMDKVFVCYPMDTLPDIDQKIIEQWRQKEVLGGRLIHLGGGTKALRQSTGAWKNTELFNFVSPEEITDWQITRKEQNDATITKGKAACETCAEIRSNNRRPHPRNMIG